MAPIRIHTSPLIWFTFVTITCSLLLAVVIASNENERKVYIAYMGDCPGSEISASTLHSSILLNVGGSVAAESLLYSYRRSFNGFVAKLTEDEARKLAEREDVVSVFPNKKMQLQTTRSWDFMGFSTHVKRSSLEGDIIVGMLDTGIWPDSNSFNRKNFGPPPKKWKGKCQKSSNFTCNNKIIGARYYRTDGQINPPDVASPLDTQGHGSHTASTAAGDIVQGASLLGLGLGEARGGVPAARLAVYKICWNDGCPNADILAAFDDAIADGVDIISLSVGPSSASDYFEDPIAIGSFHAMKNGILTSNSAGNNGPSSGSTSSLAPWILSVAASSTDRKFVTKVQLGNGRIYEGISINTFDPKNDTYPFIYAGDASFGGSGDSTCDEDSLDKKKVKGKIVLCDGFSDGQGPADAGATGVVMQNGGFVDVAYNFVLPTSYISNGSAIFNYLKSTKKPTAKILKSNTEKDRFAPTIVSFSSRGPNTITPDILKPDVAAPGVDILAAWSGATTVTGSPGDKRVVPYNIDYGTSMACPHASGATAYIKSFYPKWSPAAIKSALMTTAFPLNRARHPDLEFSYGAGHINPANATNPGLVYDAGEIDYIKFLCGQGYDSTKLKLLTGNTTSCSKATNATVWDLNYPSFTLSSNSGEPTTRVFHRTVTNVGSAVSTYKAMVNAPKGLKIQVEPNILSFRSLGEKISFVVNATITIPKSISVISGSLTWSDGVHRVRSPVVGYISSPSVWQH